MARRIRRISTAVAAAATLAGSASLAGAGTASAAPTSPADNGKHVLYLSVDGLHQSDLTQYIAGHPGSNLARLVNHGTEYTNASTTQPSDSFPGTLAVFTGATPKTTGVYYDASYDRTLYGAGSNCQGTPGTPVFYDESIDAGTGTNTRTILGENIDAARLPVKKTANGCTPVYPNQYLATNSVFSVAHAAGLYTAYSDKHPAYQILSGHGTPNSINDLFTPEINADIIPPSLVDTRGNTVTFPLNGNNNGAVITNSVADTDSYDQIKVDGILNEIDGLKSTGGATTPKAGAVPSVFGMNFQSVSVGQKLVDPKQSCVRSKNAPGCDPNYQPGGYEPGTLAFTPQLSGALDYVDGALGQMVTELNAKGLASSTQIILSAKHGQAPIDPTIHNLAGDILPNAVAAAGGTTVMDTADDIGLLWLQDPSKIQAVTDYLNANKAAYHVDTVFQGGTKPSANPLYPQFGYPGKGSLQAARQPDLIVKPTRGTIYSGSKAKVAEHGGFRDDDTHVALVVDDTVPPTPVAGALRSAAPTPTGSVVTTPVSTTQLAPTILSTLGLNYLALTGVQQQGTVPLPGTTPGPQLPEAPLAALLPVIALAAGGATFALRRRWRQPRVA
ncbi:MAG: alkaline phosphatase family protein [Actinomycetota bacterium]|nr:alkaline phosphatase family protein [Actinomycetota bacterium]